MLCAGGQIETILVVASCTCKQWKVDTEAILEATSPTCRLHCRAENTARNNRKTAFQLDPCFIFEEGVLWCVCFHWMEVQVCVCVVNNHFPSVTPPMEMKQHHSLLALCPFHLQLRHACVCVGLAPTQMCLGCIQTQVVALGWRQWVNERPLPLQVLLPCPVQLLGSQECVTRPFSCCHAGRMFSLEVH